MKKLPSTALLAIITLITQITFSQSPEIIVPLKTVIGKGNFPPRLNPLNVYGPERINFDSAKKFKGIPGGLSQTMIKELDFQPAQGIYELYKRLEGKMSPQMLLKGLDRYHTDTLSLSTVPINHSLYVLCGIKPGGQRVIITDANNNLDFSDDEQLAYDTVKLRVNAKEAEDSVPNQTIRYQFAYQGKIYDRKINLQISPYQTAFKYNNPIEQQQYVIAIANEYAEGRVEIEGNPHLVTCATTYQPPFSYDSLNTTFFISELSGKVSTTGNALVSYNVGDTLLVKDMKYSISAVDPFGRQMIFKYGGKGNSITGSDSGQFAYPISFPTLAGEPFELKALRGKYVLLDFWGSWCKPCISSIPELVNLKEKYSNHLSIVSIAYDDKANLQVINRLIKENKMEWIHLFEDMKTTNYSVINRFKITAFPTQILIDPKGKIVLRTQGTGKADLIAKMLQSNLKQ